jgi:hypothetical protein
MNWGYKLAFVYIAFAAGILTLVFKAKGEKVDLVAKDYYNQELAFSQRIAATNNAAEFSGKVKINVLENLVDINLPEECQDNSLQGTLKLYCPSDASFDRVVDLVPGSLYQMIPTEGLKGGLYLVQLKWTMNNKEYYLERSINL